MKKKKIKIITQVEIEYNPDQVSLDDIVSEIDYSFTIGDIHADVAKITNTEIQEWH